MCGLSNNQSVKCVDLDVKYVIDSLQLRRQEFSTIEKIGLFGDGDIKLPPLNTLGRLMPNLKVSTVKILGFVVVEIHEKQSLVSLLHYVNSSWICFATAKIFMR